MAPMQSKAEDIRRKKWAKNRDLDERLLEGVNEARRQEALGRSENLDYEVD